MYKKWKEKNPKVLMNKLIEKLCNNDEAEPKLKLQCEIVITKPQKTISDAKLKSLTKKIYERKRAKQKHHS